MRPGSATAAGQSRSNDRVGAGVRAWAPPGKHSQSGRLALLDQALFTEALLRERRRADRFQQPFLLVRLTATPEASRSIHWRPVVRAVADASRSTDIIGWLEHGAVLGAILPELDAHNPAVTQRVEGRFRRALAARLRAGTPSGLSLTLHVHGASTGARTRLSPADRILRSVARGRWVHSRLKRAMDLCGSAALLGILSPVYAVTAAAVKLTSSGPAFFRQTRVGQRGKPFTMLKFRTMQVNADESIHKQYVTRFIKSEEIEPAAPDKAVFKLSGDTRITRIGQFLRRSSLDELPQFWNVLRGEMSLVGPRPPLPYEVAEYRPWHCRRVLDAKPGVTGLWQVEGRSRTTFDEMVRLDIRYARTASFWTDVRILLATPLAVIKGKGAR